MRVRPGLFYTVAQDKNIILFLLLGALRIVSEKKTDITVIYAFYSILIH